MARQLLKASCAAQPKGSAHCKGPQDHLPIVRYDCFAPAMAINKPNFLDASMFYYESARYGGVFLADIEKNWDFTLSPEYRSEFAKEVEKENPPRDVSEWVRGGDSRSRTSVF